MKAKKPSQKTVSAQRREAVYRKVQELLGEVQARLQVPVLTYWNSFDGAVCNNDVNALYEILRKIGRHPKCAIFIKSQGGNGQASLKIVNLLRQYIAHVTALVPLECESAATMIALGADEIRMGPLSNLTAVDTSLKHALSPLTNTNQKVAVSLDELTRVVSLWKKTGGANDRNPYEALFQYVHPLVIGAIDRCESLSIKLCEEILSYHLKDKQKIHAISHRLNSEYPSHEYPITLIEASRIGLNVSELDSGINELLLQLNQMYSELGEELRTDYDKDHYHTSSTINILGAYGIQVEYKEDKQWHYIPEEKRWRSTNDASGWYVAQQVEKRIVKNRLYIN